MCPCMSVGSYVCETLCKEEVLIPQTCFLPAGCRGTGTQEEREHLSGLDWLCYKRSPATCAFIFFLCISPLLYNFTLWLFFSTEVKSVHDTGE